MLVGMDRETGLEISGPIRAEQSLDCIASTPLEDQPGMRSFGSELIEIISKPLNATTIMDAYGALIDIFDWEPEAEILTYELVKATETGKAYFKYSYRFIPDGTIHTGTIPRQGVTNG